MIKNDIGPAKPLAIEDAEEPGGLWGVLGEALTIALARATMQEVEIAGLKAAGAPSRGAAGLAMADG